MKSLVAWSRRRMIAVTIVRIIYFVFIDTRKKALTTEDAEDLRG
jgi:hypothetical protein